MCCLGAEAHPPPASSPSARSSIRRHCAFLPTQRPSTSRANASLFPAAGASRTNCSTLIAEPKLLVIITNVTIGPGTTAFVSPDATSRIAASALAAGHPRRHRPHRRRHLCLHPPSALPPPPYAFATLTSPTLTTSPPPPSPSYPSPPSQPPPATRFSDLSVISLIVGLIVALIVLYGTMSRAHCSDNEPKGAHY